MTNRTLIVLIGLLVHTGTAYAQGPLTPPGAPAPTMKTLDQIESRVAITNLPYVITVAGSYYLTGNLNTTGHGIVVRADGVTIDLNGYTLTGNQSTDRRGVLIEKIGSDTISGVTVINGRIEQFHSGLYIGRGVGCQFERLVLSSNAVEGVLARYGEGHRFRDLTVIDNGLAGIFLFGEGGTIRNHLIERCSILRNGFVGIAAEGLAGGRISGLRIQQVLVGNHPQLGISLVSDTGEVDGNTIEHSVVSDSGTYGILITSAGSASANSIHGCVIENTTINGIHLEGACRGNAITDCRVMDAAAGILIRASAVSAVGNTIEGCNFTGNYEGISLLAVNTGTVHATRIHNNTVTRGNAGVKLEVEDEGSVSGNHIGHSTIADNAFGIYLNGTLNGKINGNLIEACTISASIQQGVLLITRDTSTMIGNVVRDNVVANNLYGILLNELDAGSVLENNVVERNRVYGNPFGIGISGGKRNLIIQNTTDNFPVSSLSNTYGPIIDEIGVLLPTGRMAHAWANFVPLVE